MTTWTSPDGLARLRELTENATPGHWWAEWVEGDDWWAIYAPPTAGSVCPEVAVVQGLPDGSADADLIAVARAAIPELLDLIEQLRAEVRTEHQNACAAREALEQNGEPE